MKFAVLIPMSRNDGSAVTGSEWFGILEKFLVAFGGYTIEGETEGRWKADDGTIYDDRCKRLMVVAEESRKAEFLTIVKDVGRQLGQLAMFTEFSEPNVEILDIEPDDEANDE